MKTDEPRLLTPEDLDWHLDLITETLGLKHVALVPCIRAHIAALEAQAQADAELIAGLVEALGTTIDNPKGVRCS